MVPNGSFVLARITYGMPAFGRQEPVGPPPALKSLPLTPTFTRGPQGYGDRLPYIAEPNAIGTSKNK